MNAPEEKKRIMDMMKEGRISAEEAIKLIEAIDTTKTKGYAYAVAAPPAPSAPPAPKGIARMLRIRVDSQDVKVNVNVPAALAKFASQFIPPDAKAQINAQGINIAEILDLLKGELPEGRLVDVEITDMSKMDGEDGKPSRMSGPMRVTIEVI